MSHSRHFTTDLLTASSKQNVGRMGKGGRMREYCCFTDESGQTNIVSRQEYLQRILAARPIHNFSCFEAPSADEARRRYQQVAQERDQMVRRNRVSSTQGHGYVGGRVSFSANALC